MSVTIARSAPTSALNRLDLPTFGPPTIATRRLRESAARAAPSRAALELRCAAASQRRATSSPADEVIALVREIERRLEPRDADRTAPRDLAQSRRSACHRADRTPAAPAPASPRRSDRRPPRPATRSMRAVQVRAQRELARRRQPRAGAHRRRDDRARARPGCRAPRSRRRLRLCRSAGAGRGRDDLSIARSGRRAVSGAAMRRTSRAAARAAPGAPAAARRPARLRAR